MKYKIMEYDDVLKLYEADLDLRVNSYHKKREELIGEEGSIVDFANGHEYFGIHRTSEGWVYREWAPGADKMYLAGEFNGWNHRKHPMEKLANGVFELKLPKETLWNGCKVLAIVDHKGEELERIPLYARRVVQDPQTYLWTAQVYAPDTPFEWTDKDFHNELPPYIYECHVGMAQEDGKVGSYVEFADNVLWRIKELGYNTIQVMAVMEHPYYGSFGYQIGSFFAPASRSGMPEDLKYMINKAHGMGIRVLLDVVHSHAAKNTREGINEFDGTDYQFFHSGSRGYHQAWDTKLFNYGKNEVLHFLLSNLKYWMTEFHFDGFRFDGVTSMLYLDHGLGTSFDHYDKYFSMNTDIEAITYLTLANELIHELNPNALSIAEDMSGMPGMCIPINDGGIGFDYRLAMGIPDMWIRFLKEYKDEDWDMWKLWHELTSHRPHEKVIAYAESHDQALVGDKTIMFRLCDKEMYWSMEKNTQNYIVDRGVALHKMIRFITMSLGGAGYLNFMGNEFGHPEWIDFPRQGNGWSYHYCRRQWSLVDNQNLKYCWLNEFDKELISFTKEHHILEDENPYNMSVHQQDNMLIYERGSVVFTFNFHPTRSFEGYFVPVSTPGKYQAVLTSDEGRFGGQDRISKDVVYNTIELPDGRTGFFAYLPSRTAAAFCMMEHKNTKKNADKEKSDSEKPKRGRPRKVKVDDEALTENVKKTSEKVRVPKKRTVRKVEEQIISETEPTPEKPKRGRPKKVKEQTEEVNKQEMTAVEASEKPKRGRPRKVQPKAEQQ